MQRGNAEESFKQGVEAKGRKWSFTTSKLKPKPGGQRSNQGLKLGKGMGPTWRLLLEGARRERLWRGKGSKRQEGPSVRANWYFGEGGVMETLDGTSVCPPKNPRSNKRTNSTGRLQGRQRGRKARMGGRYKCAGGKRRLRKMAENYVE